MGVSTLDESDVYVGTQNGRKRSRLFILERRCMEVKYHNLRAKYPLNLPARVLRPNILL